MIRQLSALYRRYESAHLDLTTHGRPIHNMRGEQVGYIDVMRLRGGRLQVTGWAQAHRLKLVMGGAEAEAAPILRRPDVATALGLPETVGFDLSVPALLGDLAETEPPGLIVTVEPGQPDVHPISLPMRFRSGARRRVLAQFLRDGALALPDVAGWLMSRNPAHRARIKARLRLGMPLSIGPLEPWLFAADADPEQPVTPQMITIILPVYNAFDLLGDCLDRVARHTDLPWRMILIEDGSPDDRILPLVRDWAAGRDNVELLENPENRGFIFSVNRGLRRAMAYGGRDEGPIVLLNSDAFVPQDWASRLIRPFQYHEDIATVTPMSNDAEIFSAPAICTRQVLEPGQGDAIDKVAGAFAPEALLSVAPTGVGFCMAMGREWLDQVPQLDPVFGRGYGEEVDWCQKVAARGGRHLGLPGLFVEHRGGESFGSAEKRALVAKNNQIVAQRYPGYDQSVQDFIAADPMRSARLALGLAWAGSLDPDRPVPVYLAHAMGGGADHWLEHHMAEDLALGRPSVVLRVGGARRWQLELVAPEGRCQGQSDEAAVIARLIGLLPKRHVVYSCGVGDPDPLELPEMLLQLLQPGDSAAMLFHDYFPLSPSYTLLDTDGAYRGPVAAPRPDPAHISRRPDGTEVSLDSWQAGWKRFAARAELRAFSEDSAAQIRAVWPDLEGQIALRPHRLRHVLPRLEAPAPEAPRVVAVLGNIGLQKGAKVVQDLARICAKRRDLTLVLIGNIDPAYALPDSITVHGSYAVEDLPALAARYGVSDWLVPSVWPETFCYTVHEALSTGLPVLAFGIGAQGDAVRAAANGTEMPFDLGADLAQTVLNTLDRHGTGPTEQSRKTPA